MFKSIALTAAILVTTAGISACSSSLPTTSTAIQQADNAAVLQAAGAEQAEPGSTYSAVSQLEVLGDKNYSVKTIEYDKSYTIYDVYKVTLTLYKYDGDAYKKVGYTDVYDKYLKDGYRVKDLSYGVKYKITATAYDKDGNTISDDTYDGNTVYCYVEKKYDDYAYKAQKYIYIDTLRMKLKDVYYSGSATGNMDITGGDLMNPGHDPYFDTYYYDSSDATTSEDAETTSDDASDSEE